MDLGLGLAALVAQLLAELVEEVDVDADAGLLHLRQHRDERQLEPLVEIDELARLQRFFECLDEPQDDRGPAAGLVDAGIAVEVERAFDVVG